MAKTRLVAITLAAVTAFTMAACNQNPEPAILGQPDTLWQKANDPKPGLPWVVGLGDSYSSGEAGRWASNGSNNAQYDSSGGWLVGTVDQVYGDSPQGTESIPFCNRAATAPAFVGAGWNTKEFACSGAKTTSFISTDGRVKPGIDFVNATTPYGQVTGQALMLQQFAANHDVRVVTMSIGGNDMGFSDIISDCLQAFLTPLNSKTCSQSTQVGSMVNDAAKAVLTQSVANAVLNINKAMTAAGKSPKDWRLLLFTYPSPVPNPGQMQYGEGYDRQSKGGCGMLDADLLWSNTVLIPFMDQIILGAATAAKKADPELAPVTVLNTNAALDGHRLCEVGTSRPEAGTGLPPSQFGEGVEWFRFVSVIVQKQFPESTDAIEAMHPNYFGQRALATCARRALEFPATPAALTCQQDGDTTFDQQSPPLLTNVRVKPPTP